MQSEETIKPSTLALWEIVSVIVSCLIAEWVVLAFVGPSTFATRDSDRARFSADDLFSHVSTARHCATSAFALDNFIACREASRPADHHRHRVDHFCFVDRFERFLHHVLCVGDYSARSVLGTVSTVCIARLLEPSRSDRLWQRLEECAPGRTAFCHCSSTKPAALCPHVSRWGNLGRDLSERTESLRTRRVTLANLDHRRTFCPTHMDKQPACRLQILWLVRAIPV